MTFFESFKEALPGKPEHLQKPLFYKADSDALKQMDLLKSYYDLAPDKIQPLIERDMRMLQYGIAGEDSVAFELNNSFLPIIILHDLHMVYEDLSAQIDFFVITEKFNLVIECKNLYGNIDVTNKGEFIRSMTFRGIVQKEGIYSPITQNTRHLEFIKKVRSQNQSNMVMKFFFEKFFDDNFQSVVVLANQKTIINMKSAPMIIQKQIIRCDQLNDHIRRMLRESKSEKRSVKTMYEIADIYLGMHTPNTFDYAGKYAGSALGEIEIDTSKLRDTDIPQTKQIHAEWATDISNSKEHAPKSAAPIEPPLLSSQSTQILTNSPLYQALKEYRYDASKAENIKAYYIFSNLQLEAIIQAMPQTVNDLMRVSGFGENKCKKYGPAIVAIVRKYTKS